MLTDITTHHITSTHSLPRDDLSLSLSPDVYVCVCVWRLHNNRSIRVTLLYYVCVCVCVCVCPGRESVRTLNNKHKSLLSRVSFLSPKRKKKAHEWLIAWRRSKNIMLRFESSRCESSRVESSRIESSRLPFLFSFPFPVDPFGMNESPGREKNLEGNERQCCYFITATKKRLMTCILYDKWCTDSSTIIIIIIVVVVVAAVVVAAGAAIPKVCKRSVFLFGWGSKYRDIVLQIHSSRDILLLIDAAEGGRERVVVVVVVIVRMIRIRMSMIISILDTTLKCVCACLSRKRVLTLPTTQEAGTTFHFFNPTRKKGTRGISLRRSHNNHGSIRFDSIRFDSAPFLFSFPFPFITLIRVRNQSQGEETW